MADNWKEVVAEWHSGDAFTGRNASGGMVQIGTIDGKPGISPMEMLLLGVAGCTGMDITSILRKQRQSLEKFQVRVRGNRSETYPKVYTEIEVTYLLWGENLDRRAVEQAIRLSEEKYCSVGITMQTSGAQLRSSYQILAPGESIDEIIQKL